jgi:hypothetical protein
MLPFGRDLLAIYLQDHLAGATLGAELARRSAGEHSETPLGTTLRTLQREIEEDRETLKLVMSTLGVGADRLKNAAGWAGEKVGRLKLNGRLTSRSPLSAVLELEALMIGVNGKRALWRALRGLADTDARLQASQFDELILRADRQLDALWSAHADAAATALAVSA